LRTFWRISGLIITASGFICGVAISLEDKYDLLDDSLDHKIFRVVFCFVPIRSAIIYMAARVYFVVEASIGLRDLSVEAH
jgi:hypothetical protein